MLLAGGASLGNSMDALFRAGLSLPRAALFDASVTYIALRDATLEALIGLAPFLTVLALAAVAAPLALGGWVLNFEQLAAQLDRLDPIKGLKRVFGWQGFVEMLKALVKFALIGATAIFVMYADFERVLAMGHGSLPDGVRDALWMVAKTFMVVSAATIVVALLDVPFQLWQYARQLRMSRQQVREELKDTEGRPEVRSRIRQMQQELASRRMMQEVPKADVVVTNPTHFAVALRYNPDKMGAPRVVAKGVDLIAQRIQAVAREHKVTCLEAPPLARALFYATDLNQEIPKGLYVAVAQVLVYVFQLRKGAELRPPRDLPIPDELRR
jgi:flagellar biosynthetic protein FlhB